MNRRQFIGAGAAGLGMSAAALAQELAGRTKCSFPVLSSL
jgi:hypothetical protein